MIPTSNTDSFVDRFSITPPNPDAVVSEDKNEDFRKPTFAYFLKAALAVWMAAMLFVAGLSGFLVLQMDGQVSSVEVEEPASESEVRRQVVDPERDIEVEVRSGLVVVGPAEAVAVPETSSVLSREVRSTPSNR